MSTNYQQVLEYLYSQLPMFHRIGAAAYKANLDNTLSICELLNHPEEKFKSIHIAGTNGKGSTSHMLAAILQTAGYKTGLYTSPHLVDFRERIRINGEMIPEMAVSAFVEDHKELFEKIQPSFFEWTVGLAFDYFAGAKVDIAVLETGLGGRLDSTNVVVPELSVITNIGLDHMNLLGDTLQKIAAEKAGIIKRNVPVIIGMEQLQVKEVFTQKAEEVQAPLVFADSHYKAAIVSSNDFLEVKVENSRGEQHYYKLDLRGRYQAKNLVTVLQVVDILKQRGWKIQQQDVQHALENVGLLTGLQGRWQIIGQKPLIICDVGHNEDGIRELLDCIRLTPHNKLHIVLGIVSDKMMDGMLDLLPASAHYYFCKADTPRSLDAGQLREKAAMFGLKGDAHLSVKEALDTAKRIANAEDLIIVTGSTFVVAEVIG